MNIRDILRTKGHEVVTVSSHRTVLEAVRLLVERNIGGVVVVDTETETGHERVTGILTERDILRLAALDPAHLASKTVGEVMTRELIIGSPEDDLHEVMSVMTENRIRHLPVITGDRLAGIVSIGDLVNACRRVAEQENTHLRRYIQGVVS